MPVWQEGITSRPISYRLFSSVHHWIFRLPRTWLASFFWVTTFSDSASFRLEARLPPSAGCAGARCRGCVPVELR